MLQDVVQLGMQLLGCSCYSCSTRRAVQGAQLACHTRLCNLHSLLTFIVDFHMRGSRCYLSSAGCNIWQTTWDQHAADPSSMTRTFALHTCTSGCTI